MAPNKRARPSFSPPRPRKSTTKTSASTSSTNKPKARSTAQKPKQATRPATTKSKPASTKDARRRSRLVSPTPSASDSLGNASSDQDESMNIDEDDDGDDDDGDETAIPNRAPEDSPEPDYILAEVTHESASSSDPAIPLGLIHRILHSQFSAPDTTKISTDAREVVGKYIEVFVREAIMRCAYEKNEESNAQAGGGWLEVEDLEKVAVQLCLDF